MRRGQRGVGLRGDPADRLRPRGGGLRAAPGDLDGIEDLRVEIWEGVGHMPMVEAPAGSARLYREFLASLRSESPQDQRLH